MRDAATIADDLMTNGSMPSEQEVYGLCSDAVTGQMAADALQALIDALSDAGMKVIDTTTDDSDGIELSIIPLDDDETALSPVRDTPKPVV